MTQDAAPEHAIAHEDHDGGSPEEDGAVAGQPHGGAPAGAEGGDVRRRRRRGRRGGRRNRRDRNGEAPFNPNNGPEPEPALQHAVEDLDRPPAFEPAPAYQPPRDERPAPPATEAQAPSSGDNGQPRRRSTVREPAPIAVPGAPPAPASTLPPPTPVISSTASEDSGTPKRGWWGKRVLGDKE